MTTPEFREPESGKKRPRRMLSPDAADRRYRYLDTIDRRCDAQRRSCITAANVIIRAIPLTDGVEGEEITLKSCTRHRRQFVYATDKYKILSVVQLPPGEQVTKAERNRRI